MKTWIFKRMTEFSQHWKEFLDDGKTAFKINLYHRMHLKLLISILKSLKKNGINRKSVIGKIAWGGQDVLQHIMKTTSPWASDIYWFSIENRMLIKNFDRIRVGFFVWEVTCIRKDKFGPRSLGMTYDSFKKLHKLRKHT